MNLQFPVDNSKHINQQGIAFDFQDMDKNIGFLFENEKIIFPKNSNKIYQRFCMAYFMFWHEIYPEKNIVYRSDFNYPNIFPVQNNILLKTMDCLVPKFALNIMINKRKISDVEKLMNIFGISLSLLRAQLKRFDFI